MCRMSVAIHYKQLEPNTEHWGEGQKQAVMMNEG